ncbi:PREDICTED: chromo domain-containing protein cec-1-like [Gavialis gangeticus]|uniref:chromo domain-containing protein cec-1-like n=1 Tax=Gavialis gangeticus TaxID=94835 RepID=UPI00092E8A22|nr:PREDICTED: chromo domain-containing protein cec-1-like [Gavialis gangeticus]XP_019371011.1 PREDICTED: chromo domain-containing protein cec-1-like [Gavialis gangeticus]
MKVQDLRPSAGPHLGKVMKPMLNILKALQPKVGLLAQLAAHHTEKEEREEKVEDKLEAEQQWEEEEELQQIEEIIQIKSSLYLRSPLASSMDSEQLSENVEEPSAALGAQRASECSSADTCQAWDTEDSPYTS